MAAARIAVRPPGGWSWTASVLVAVAPIAGAIAAAWVELSQPGETAMWIVAGACFFVAPGVAAVATERGPAPGSTRRLIAVTLFVALFAIWLVNVPAPTHPGIHTSGGSAASGAVMAGGAALAWFLSTWWAATWVRWGWPRRAVLFGGCPLALLSLAALVLGFLTP